MTIEYRKIGRIEPPVRDVDGVILYAEKAYITSELTVAEIMMLSTEISKAEIAAKGATIFTMQALAKMYHGLNVDDIADIPVGKSREIVIDAECAMEIHRVSEHFVFGNWLLINIKKIEEVNEKPRQSYRKKILK